MKWLRWSTVALSLVTLCLVIGMVAVSIKVDAAVYDQVDDVTAAIPSLDEASGSRQQPPPSNEISDFQQLD